MVTDFPAKKCDEQHHHRNATEHDERKFPRRDENEGQAADEDDGLANRLGDGGEKSFTHQGQIGGDAVAQGARALILKVGNRQVQEMFEKIFAQTVQCRLTRANEALNAEISDRGLKEQNRDKFQDHLVDAREDFRCRNGSACGIDRIADEFFEEIGESQRQPSGQEQRDERGDEDFLLSE